MDSQLCHRARSTLDKQASLDSEQPTYTIDDCFDRCRLGGAFHWLMLLYCGLSWACDAMEVMILSYLGPSAQCQWQLTATEESLLTSMVFLGMCLGAPVWGMLSDAVGRKMSFLGATLCTTIFGFATAAAPNYYVLLAFRTLVGFGIPGAVVAFNLLLEFTPTRLRGLFAVGIEGFWTLGTLVQAGMAYALLNTHGWRLLVTISTIPYVVLLLFIFWVPESPRYLLVKGKVDQAEQVLRKVMKWSKAEMPEGRLRRHVKEDDDQHKPLATEQSKGCKWLSKQLMAAASSVWSSLKQLFSRQLALTTCALIFVWMVSAFVYYGLVNLVAQVDFVSGGEKTCNNGRLYIPTADLTAILITSSAEVPGLIFSLIVVYFCSRKVAFAVPLALIAVVLIPVMTGVQGPGLIVCMYLSRFFIYSSFNILWTMTPEYYPTCIRNFGLGLNNSFSRIGGLLSPFAVVNARQTAWKYSPQAIFAALSLVAAGSVFSLPPDKKDQVLDDSIADVKAIPRGQNAAPAFVASVARLGGSAVRRVSGSHCSQTGSHACPVDIDHEAGHSNAHGMADRSRPAESSRQQLLVE